MKTLTVKEFNKMCDNEKDRWYMFDENDGYVAFSGDSLQKIAKAVFAKTKKEAIARYLNDTY